MKRVLGNNALGCMLLVACVSCADALGLHDLVQGRTGGELEGDSAAPGDPGDDAALPPAIPMDADLVEASAPAPSASAASPTGATSEGTSADADADADAGTSASRPDSGTSASRPDSGASSAMAGGAPVVEAGAPEPEGGAAPPAPPPPGPASACGCPACVMHSNGVGETFQDCVASGTHDAMQALEACSAFTGSNADCANESCTGGGGGPGKTSGQAVCGTRSSVCDCWAFAGTEVGLVQTSNGNCKPCGNGGAAWN